MQEIAAVTAVAGASNCACSGLFTLGAKSKELTLFYHASWHARSRLSRPALIKGLRRRTAEDVITIGQALVRQKAALPHGSFRPWMEAEFGMSGPTASRFMNVAEIYGSEFFQRERFGPDRAVAGRPVAAGSACRSRAPTNRTLR
jgi:Protein of unknown function (DUF3102)